VWAIKIALFLRVDNFSSDLCHSVAKSVQKTVGYKIAVKFFSAEVKYSLQMQQHRFTIFLFPRRQIQQNFRCMKIYTNWAKKI